MPKFTEKLDELINNVYDSRELKAFEGKTLLCALNNGLGSIWDVGDREGYFKTKEKEEDGWQEQRIGRLIRAIYPQVLDSRIEIMVNSVKTILKYETVKKNFKIINGKSISKYYKTKNYAKPVSHTLAGSCMNNASDSRFAFHADNDDRIKLLVYKDPEQDDKIQARAYLFTKCWVRVGENAKERNKEENKIWGKVLDRIYGNSDYYMDLMRMYAVEQGWFVRNGGMSFAYGDKNVTARVKITIPKTENWANHAYSDTLKYLSESGTLSNKTWKKNVPDYDDEDDYDDGDGWDDWADEDYDDENY